MTSLTTLLDSALAARNSLVDDEHFSAYRLFNGFMEGIPALCLDIYAQTALIQDYGLDAENIPIIQDWLLDKLAWVRSILVKPRGRHTNTQTRGSLLYGSSPDERVRENDVWYSLDLSMNRDASFYLDTRNLRVWAKASLAGKSVLNTFAYTGSLGVAAHAGGAVRVIQVDRNARYLALAQKSLLLNGLSISADDFIAQDFFPAVSMLKQNRQTFDCVFLDPPFFSSTGMGRVDLEKGSTRLINKVRPLVKHDGWLVVINNALFVNGQEFLASLQGLCTDGYLEIEEFVPVPDDFIGYSQTRVAQFPQQSGAI